MEIGVVGLGLIGGSLAKTIKNKTAHRVWGLDIDHQVMLKAQMLQAIDGELTDEKIADCQLLILSLYPHDTVSFLEQHQTEISQGAMVIDCCGVKEFVCNQCQAIAAQNGFLFLGGHPMAGLAKSGFEYSDESLFQDASMILVPDKNIDIHDLAKVKQFFLTLGFGSIKITTPWEHDQMIAYTSQLAHILSSAYIKSPVAPKHHGFSAGSFKDMTRVATLNEAMWVELFLLNQEHLLTEVNGLISRLTQYATALQKKDGEALADLLKEGKEQKALCE